MIFVTGGSGQVGKTLLSALTAAKVDYYAPSRSTVDLNQLESIASALESRDFTAIVHLAAETNVDWCQKNRTQSLIRNFHSTQILARYAQKRDIPIVFVSSSAVMSGSENFLHRETELPNPANYYAETKLLSENFIRETNLKFLIIRAGWMLGRNPIAPKFAELIVSKVRNGERILAVDDKFGSLTSATRLSNFILSSLTHQLRGTIHFGSTTYCSRYQLAVKISELLSLQSDIHPVKNEVFGLAAPRGLSEGLHSSYDFGYLGHKLLTWEEELQSFLDEEDSV
jgi:dTDP-4-dehydrorhamnose reductase